MEAMFSITMSQLRTWWSAKLLKRNRDWARLVNKLMRKTRRSQVTQILMLTTQLSCHLWTHLWAWMRRMMRIMWLMLTQCRLLDCTLHRARSLNRLLQIAVGQGLKYRPTLDSVANMVCLKRATDSFRSIWWTSTTRYWAKRQDLTVDRHIALHRSAEACKVKS